MRSFCNCWKCVIENARANASGVAFVHVLHGVEDAYIVNNVFRNLIGYDNGKTNLVLRAVSFYGKAGQSSWMAIKRGITASNYIENLQSNERWSDAEIFAAKGIGTKNYFEWNHLFLANVGVNAWKRMIKAQSGWISAHSNFNWWKDYRWPAGIRHTRVHFASQAVSNNRWTNNTARTDHANPNSEAIFVVIATRNDGWIKTHDYESHDVVFSNNVYELNTDWKNTTLLYGFVNIDYHFWEEVTWQKDSEMNDNVVRGSWELRNYYWFRRGWGKAKSTIDEFWNEFHHERNVFKVPNTRGSYKE